MNKLLQEPSSSPLPSDAMWLRADKFSGGDMQEMVKDIITNVVTPRGFSPAHDVQVEHLSRIVAKKAQSNLASIETSTTLNLPCDLYKCSKAKDN